MRFVYSLLMYLALPWILGFLAWRGLKDRGYAGNLRQRFGLFPAPPQTDGIALHAASVGEVNAAAPLVRALLRQAPDLPITITTFTPTGARRVRSLFGHRVFHVFAPLDLPGSVRRFLDRVRPRALIVMETEIWPNLFALASRRGLPLLMANARLTDRSLRGYARARKLISQTLAGVAWAGAQTREDADRLIACGVPAARVQVSGNLKFELAIDEALGDSSRALREAWGPRRPVIVAGSTHGADELVLLPAFHALLEQLPDALLVLAPRHPERFSEAAEAAADAGMEIVRHSDGETAFHRAQVLVVDAMGELMHYYAAGDIAFVGGTFGTVGGHSLVEPAALGKPVLFGPNTENAEDTAQRLIACGGGIRVASGPDFLNAAARLLQDSRVAAKRGESARRLVEDSRGALAQHLSALRHHLRQ